MFEEVCIIEAGTRILSTCYIFGSRKKNIYKWYFSLPKTSSFNLLVKRIGRTDWKPIISWFSFCFLWQEGLKLHVWSVTVSGLCTELSPPPPDVGFSPKYSKGYSLYITLHSFSKFYIERSLEGFLKCLYYNIQNIEVVWPNHKIYFFSIFVFVFRKMFVSFFVFHSSFSSWVVNRRIHVWIYFFSNFSAYILLWGTWLSLNYFIHIYILLWGLWIILIFWPSAGALVN